MFIHLTGKNNLHNLSTVSLVSTSLDQAQSKINLGVQPVLVNSEKLKINI